LPGRRVAAMRAGISTKMRGSVIGTRSAGSEEQAGNNRGLAESRGVYTGCQRPGKPISQPC
jgi:hypothetical protein